MSSDARRKKKQTNKLTGTPAIILAADAGDLDKVIKIVEVCFFSFSLSLSFSPSLPFVLFYGPLARSPTIG